MKLYHASTIVVGHPDVVHSRPNLDFGCGFYLTAKRDQAVRYAERFTRRGRPASVVPIHYHPTKEESFILLKAK